MVIRHKQNTSIREDEQIVSLLKRMPNDEIKNSFTDEQLENLKIAMGARQWKTHALDLRFTFPFFDRRYYVVLVAGRSIRSSRLQKLILRRAEVIFISLLLMFSISLGLLVLYLLKSAMGINLFDDFSLGIWDWFQSL